MSSYIGIVFCDNNACLENNFNEICNEPILFILVINKGGKIDIKIWELQKLSKRQYINYCRKNKRTTLYQWKGWFYFRRIDSILRHYRHIQTTGITIWHRY